MLGVVLKAAFGMMMGHVTIKRLLVKRLDVVKRTGVLEKHVLLLLSTAMEKL